MAYAYRQLIAVESTGEEQLPTALTWRASENRNYDTMEAYTPEQATAAAKEARERWPDLWRD